MRTNKKERNEVLLDFVLHKFSSIVILNDGINKIKGQIKCYSLKIVERWKRCGRKKDVFLVIFYI